jgi:hypothetical protein
MGYFPVMQGTKPKLKRAFGRVLGKKKAGRKSRLNIPLNLMTLNVIEFCTLFNNFVFTTVISLMQIFFTNTVPTVATTWA